MALGSGGRRLLPQGQLRRKHEPLWFVGEVLKEYLQIAVSYVFERRGGVKIVTGRLGESFCIGMTQPVRGQEFKAVSIDRPTASPGIDEEFRRTLDD